MVVLQHLWYKNDLQIEDTYQYNDILIMKYRTNFHNIMLGKHIKSSNNDINVLLSHTTHVMYSELKGNTWNNTGNLV